MVLDYEASLLLKGHHSTRQSISLCVHSMQDVLQIPLPVAFALCSALRYVYCKKFQHLRHVIRVLVTFFLSKKASIWFYRHSTVDLCLLNNSLDDWMLYSPRLHSDGGWQPL